MRCEKGVYWLSGLAGTGKSTIARTVARRHFEQGSLAASFFFTKGGGDCSHAGKFVTSIAAQLARNVPATRQHICEEVAKHNDISTLSLHDQWRQLVLQPLSSMSNWPDDSSLVLVIDALDECDDFRSIRAVMELLFQAQALSRPKLRIFLTSRPEAAVRHGFNRMSRSTYRHVELHRLPHSMTDVDIELFLKDGLANIGRDQGLPANWPSPEVITKMVQRADGLFIWAATAHRFIRDGRRFAAQRLNSIIKEDGDSPEAPEKHLDNIYLTVLRASIHPEFTDEEKEQQYKMLRFCLGSLVVLQSPLSRKHLARLLDVTTDDISAVFQDLHAILRIPPHESHGTIRLHHPSLRDFLLDSSRCTDVNFCVDEAQAHGVLASLCIKFLERRFKKREGAQRDAGDMTRFVSRDMKYAVLYWARHHERSGLGFKDGDKDFLFVEGLGFEWEALLWDHGRGSIFNECRRYLKQNNVWLLI